MTMPQRNFWLGVVWATALAVVGVAYSALQRTTPEQTCIAYHGEWRAEAWWRQSYCHFRCTRVDEITEN